MSTTGVFKKAFELLLRVKTLHRLPGMSMSRVFVRNVQGDDRLQITFRFPPDNLDAKLRVYNFDRLKAEELERTLERITTNVSKVVNKKTKKNAKSESNANSDPAPLDVALCDSELKPLSVSELNETAWISGRRLHIGDHHYSVHVNVPTIKKMLLPDVLLVGFAVKVNLQVEFASYDTCQFVWYRLPNNGGAAAVSATAVEQDNRQMDVDNSCEHVCVSESAEKVSTVTWQQKRKSKNGKNIGRLQQQNWELIHNGRTYTPAIADIGCFVKVDCIPSDGEMDGELFSAVSKSTVSQGPFGTCPFEKRHEHTKQLTGTESFRFVTYNILADAYADSDYSRDYLFPYCPPEQLSIDYRKLLILKELIGYNADIICLQEVDKKIFQHDLYPSLKDVGLVGLLRLKAGEVPEGTAMFYRESKFRLLSQHDVCLSEILQNDPLYADLKKKISSSETLKEKVFARTSTLQATILESSDDSNRRILVATTHLYFHPRAPHIRVLQTAVCLRHIEMILSQVDGPRPTVIFCGDLNSYPDGGVHTLLTRKHIAAGHADWYAAGKEDFVEGLDLRHGLDLVSACGYPRYTNFVAGFAGCLDYIYVEPKQLSTTSVVPLPTHDEVTLHTALPNAVFPSDHLALVCELSWIGQNSI